MLTTFTTFTWRDLGGYGLTRETGRDLGWMKQHDLAVEAYETTKDELALTFEDWRAIVSAICSGLPVELTTRHRLTGTDRVETSKRMSLITQMTSCHTGVYNTSVRAWGFATTFALRDIVAVTVPEAVYSYDTEGER